MKKVGIVTIIDKNNYGNRLQNYATQKVLEKLNIKTITIKNDGRTNMKDNKIVLLMKLLKNHLMNIKNYLNIILNGNIKRAKCFGNFNKYIHFSKRLEVPKSKLGEKYDYYIVGSDQVWKPTYNRMRDMDLLNFTENSKKIAFAASIGINKMPDEKKQFFAERVKNFKKISVREDVGKEIVEDLTNRDDIEVLVDPTMLLTDIEWDNVSKKPPILDNQRYILLYFLGGLSEDRKKEIYSYAEKNECAVINILDKNSPFYQTGPSEFLYLEKHAFLICTDSFHSCVFSIIYNRPFIVFEREGNVANMSSRIETLIKKFDLEDREFTGKITEKNIRHDYTGAYIKLEKERKKSIEFLNDALSIKKN